MRTSARAVLVVAVMAAATLAGITATPSVAGAAVDTSWKPSAGSVPASGNYAYIASTSGDYIGGGKTYLYQSKDTDLTSDMSGVRFDFGIEGYQSWDLRVELPSSASGFTKGAVYTGLTRYPFNGNEGGISFSGEGRGCNEDFGWLAVDDLVIAEGVVQSYLVRFEQRCESASGSPLRGQIRFDANEPLPPAPTPTKTVPGGLWSPASNAVPASGNYWYMTGTAGDYVSQGKSYLYTGAQLEFDGSAGSHLRTSIDHPDDWWYMDFAASNRSDSIVAGYYSPLGGYPFHNPVFGGFDVSGNGRGCGGNAWVVVDELDSRLAQTSDITLRWEMHCGSSSPVNRGKMHWETPPAAGTPGLPTGVTATAIKRGAKVNWNAPASSGSSAITGYQVIVYEQGDAVATIDLPSSARTYTFDDLTVGVPHRFKVRALNGSGAGARSAASPSVSPLDPKPAVTGLSPATGPRTGGTSVQVLGQSFTGVTDVKFGTTSVPFSFVSDGRVDVTSPNLTAGTYDVRVVTPDGTSAVVAADKWTAKRLPPGAPTGVTGTPKPGAIDASWTAPANSGDDPITGYTATVTKVGSASPAATVGTGAATTTAAFTGLEPGASYTVKVVAVSAAGSGAVGASAPVMVPAPTKGPFSSIANLVKQQWLDFVGRNPTAAESTAGVDAITSGDLTSEAYIALMSKKSEFTKYRAPVIRLYSAYFNRLPDYGGFNYWVGKLRSGTSLNKASSTFAASSEFKNKYGSLSNRNFVLLIYTNVLKRSPDTSGVNYWTKKLDGGMSRGQVMTNFSESSENVRKMQNTVDVVLLHAGMLKKMPSASVVTEEAGKLAGGTPLADLAGRLLVGAAYADRF